MPRPFFPLLLPLLPLLSLSSTALSEDLVLLLNQDEVRGRIVSDDGETLVVETQSPRGKVTLPYTALAAINGLPAPGLQSLRRESHLARRVLADRSVPSGSLPLPLLLGADDFAARRRAADVPAAVVWRFRAMEKFRLVPSAWDAAAGIPTWRGSRRWADWDPKDEGLRLIVPRGAEAGPAGPFWQACGVPEERYPILRESGRQALSSLFRLAAGRAGLTAWDDRALAFEAAETGLAAAMALDVLLAPVGLAAGQGETPFALAELGAGPEPPGTPAFLRAWRAFSELDGARFHRTALLAGGWRLALRVLDDPPVSSEQILHPERYFVARDTPVSVTLPIPALPQTEGDAAYVQGGTLGEWMIFQSLLASGGAGGGGEEAARRAAAGWDGDAWVVFAAPGREPLLVWVSVWDTPGDAREFAEAEVAAALSRGERGRRIAGEDRVRLEALDGFGVVEWRGTQVVAVESARSAEGAAALAETAWRTARFAEDPTAPTAKADAAAVAGAARPGDRLAAIWQTDPPASLPISGVVEPDPAGGFRIVAAGAFVVPVPEGWVARTEPNAAILIPPDPPGASVTLTFHRLPEATPAPLVFARAWIAAAPRMDGAFLPYRTRTADGRAWCQFTVPAGDRRIHLAWAVSGVDLIRVEAVAPPGGAPEGVRAALQEMLGRLRFDR